MDVEFSNLPLYKQIAIKDRIKPFAEGLQGKNATNDEMSMAFELILNSLSFVLSSENTEMISASTSTTTTKPTSTFKSTTTTMARSHPEFIELSMDQVILAPKSCTRLMCLFESNCIPMKVCKCCCSVAWFGSQLGRCLEPDRYC